MQSKYGQSYNSVVDSMAFPNAVIDNYVDHNNNIQFEQLNH